MYLCQHSCALTNASHKAVLTQLDRRDLCPLPPWNEFENMIPFFNLIAKNWVQRSVIATGFARRDFILASVYFVNLVFNFFYFYICVC